jgi:polar amino acid transport system substrate-binding protein
MKKFIIIALLLFASSAMAQNLDQIVWMTEEYAPYNYIENGTPTGISVDILVEIWKKVGLKKTVKDIQFLPWARGYHEVQKKTDTCLFSMDVTEPRKKMFKFVGPLVDADNVIIAKKNKKIIISGDEDLKKYKIGAIREDVGEQLLVEKGFPKENLDIANGPDILVRKIEADRHDAISYGFDSAAFYMKKEKIDSSAYEIVYTINKGYLSLAFHKDTDPSVINKLQKALDEIKADGTVAKILAKYK